MLDGVTGTFFHEQTAESLATVLASFDESLYHPQTIRNHALDFDKPRFQRRVLQFIEAKMSATRVQKQGWDAPSNEFAR